ncbi:MULTISPECIES: ABC transporter ATP-binding protein [Mycobacterium]|uniref:Daunorubicin resistance ABC transporter ATP-binding subunit DrrA n=2 Tax=Mycobacterium ulcerans group TaxID=2993898 RepID=A0A9N7LM60_9MYCO|nr:MULTISPECIES: ABC transporter ATP-binding protein [Mycobacterium]ULL08941.1 ABC transporter ATP-binding protein [Mycobacterium liflandii]AGC60290.1 ATP-binding protein ABC transporter [Mycobacterium liflandii 128FXT]EPQ44768.1 ABC transporter, ATP-binding protein [Mycobacterium sp. 012931]MBC9862496.1 ABC transporter, ATP-binding protein [Mycobacterium pseudoshottsii]RFZ56992.1 Daunorubicin/doxorubicin resistance ATP-binding protein DrrA [Mycobacterium marinum]
MSSPESKTDNETGNSQPGTSALEAVDLVKSYPGSDANAVDGLNLVIPRGVVYCLLGRNGAGKTTTIRMATTLLTPTSGQLEVLGVPVDNTTQLRPLIGVALQEVALDLWMSPVEQIRMSLAMAGWPKSDRKRREGELVEQFGLGKYLNRKVGALSGGMRRRVDVALAVAHNPQMLFLDEPSSGLDIEGKQEVWNAIRLLRSEGRTVVLTTHDMDEAVSLADEVGIIKDGVLVAAGSTQEFTRSHGFAVDISAPQEITDDAVRQLAGAGYPMQRKGSSAVTGSLDSASASEIGSLATVLDRLGLAGANIEIRSTSLRDAFLEATQ